MSKPFINSMIKKLTLSGQTTKVTPWMVEGLADGREAHVRYLGIKPDSSWETVLSSDDNLLLKFSIIDKVSAINIYFANKPPFIELGYKVLDTSDTWESIIGKLKQRIKKESAEYSRGESTVNNLYRKIKPFLKK